MRQITVNLTLVVVWMALSAGLARLIYAANESSPLGASTSVGIWLVGQLLILSPLVYVIWRDRAIGAKTPKTRK